jgi:hypothetical protein
VRHRGPVMAEALCLMLRRLTCFLWRKQRLLCGASPARMKDVMALVMAASACWASGKAAERHMPVCCGGLKAPRNRYGRESKKILKHPEIDLRTQRRRHRPPHASAARSHTCTHRCSSTARYTRTRTHSPDSPLLKARRGPLGPLLTRLRRWRLFANGCCPLGSQRPTNARPAWVAFEKGGGAEWS